MTHFYKRELLEALAARFAFTPSSFRQNVEYHNSDTDEIHTGKRPGQTELFGPTRQAFCLAFLRTSHSSVALNFSSQPLFPFLFRTPNSSGFATGRRSRFSDGNRRQLDGQSDASALHHDNRTDHSNHGSPYYHPSQEKNPGDHVLHERRVFQLQ